VSSIDKLMLDTCVLRDAHFLYWLAGKRRGKISISAIAYTEQLRQIIHNGGSIVLFDNLLKKCKITVEPFDKYSAETAAVMSNDPKVCDKCQNFNWADTMIYANLGNPPTRLVTNNTKDYPSDDRVLTPNELRQILG